MSELKNRLEAILFASGKGISETDLVEHTRSKLREVKKELKKLQEEYQEKEGSLSVVETENKWKISVKGKYTTDIQKIISETELPKPILKTLAVIAYKSPVLQSDVIHMRGQGAYEHVKLLSKQKLITKDEEGRSYILKITDKFYNYFDVEGDEDIRDMFKKLRETHEKKLGDLEIVDVTTDKDKTETVGNLEVINVEVQTAKRTPEELEEENLFLKRIEKNISLASERIESHDLPERHSHPELEKEQQTLDDTTMNINDVKKAMAEEKKKEKKENPLEEIKQFVEKEKNKEEKTFL